MTTTITSHIANEVTALNQAEWPAADSFGGMIDRFHTKLEAMTTILVDALDLADADPESEIAEAVMDAQYSIDELHTLLTQLYLAEEAIDSVLTGANLIGLCHELEAELLALTSVPPRFLRDEAKSLSREVLKNEQQAMRIINQSLQELRS